MTKKNKIVIGSIIGFLLFIWFQLRPMGIRSYCQRHEYDGYINWVIQKNIDYRLLQIYEDDSSLSRYISGFEYDELSPERKSKYSIFMKKTITDSDYQEAKRNYNNCLRRWGL